MVHQGKRALSVGGGKGGIGKSCFSANIGIALSRQGRRVVLVDTDIEAPNLHTFVGITYPQRTLDDYLNSMVMGIEEIVLPTPVPRLRLISSAGSGLSLSGPNYPQRQRFFRAVMGLDADTIIFDVAAGARMRVIDYFSIAPIMVIILEPIPTALENAYGFLKNLLYRHLLRIFYTDKPTHRMILDVLGEKSSRAGQSVEALLAVLDRRSHEKTETFSSFIASLNHIYVVINRVRSKEQEEIIDRFARVVKRYLMLNLRFGGFLPFEPDMDKSIIARTPFIMQFPDSPYAKAMESIILNLQL
ncbi:MAG: P-loop NTPase [Chitinispirillaceae bacterium]|nr:P-loop NTPase [Chitinispirillaceae bacterium]